MNGLVILIPIALLMGLAGLAAFLWALRNGQFQDPDGAAMRILIDDEEDTGRTCGNEAQKGIPDETQGSAPDTTR